MTSSPTAILLFSHTAHDEARVKTFTHKGGKKKNLLIAEKLITHTQKVARKTGLPFFTCFGDEQTGSSFGERLANAIENIFDEGYERVITIGNDCPSLSPANLQNVNQSLDTNGVVLGPATDGGVYLIGVSRDAFNRKNFLELPWKEQDLQTGFTHYAERLSVSVEWLDSRQDIDNESDLNRFLSIFKNKGWRFIKQLQCILASFVHSCIFLEQPFFPKIVISHLHDRAPPV